MKALVHTAPNVLVMQERPTPEPGPGQVRIRTVSCGICATDLCMLAGWDRTSFGAIPGHEWTGVVDAVGPGVDPALVAKPCVADNVLSDGGEVGFEHPGGYASHFLTEAKNVLVLPDGFDRGAAALVEPLAVSIRGAHRLAPTGGALIFGDGPIGLLMLMLLRRAGLGPVHLVGGRPGRLALASSLGASRALDYHALGADLTTGIAAALDLGEVSSFVEASGSVAALSASLGLARRGGRILVLGDYGEARADFAWNTVLHKELVLVGSNASAGAWPEAVSVGADPWFGLGRLVTHRLPVERFAEGLALAASRMPTVVKVILDWSA